MPHQETPGRQSSSHRTGRMALFVGSAALVCIGFFASQGGIPQAEEKLLHWDVSIYLRWARSEIDLMPLTRHYDWDFEQQRLLDGVASDRYRKLVRYGHIWLISRIYAIAGAGLAGLQAAMNVYSILLCLSLLLLFASFRECLRQCGTDDSPPAALDAASIAGVLMLAGSGLATYLNGHLVSEVPAVFYMSLFCLLWMLTMGSRSALWTGLTGVPLGILLAAIYLTRLESGWTLCSFLATFSALFWYRKPARQRLFLLSGATLASGAACYLASAVKSEILRANSRHQ